MFRAVSAKLCREWAFILVGALCLLGAADYCPAAGCHVSDRPVVSSRLVLAIDLSVTAPPQAPDVLTHPRCPTEIPRLLDPAGVSLTAALRHWIGLDVDGRSIAVITYSHRSHAQPLSDPLDRPPRHIAEHGVVGLTV